MALYQLIVSLIKTPEGRGGVLFISGFLKFNT